jgi:hypothetical protein
MDVCVLTEVCDNEYGKRPARNSVEKPWLKERGAL